uniref:Uncharacterized protein n=1 Tax=Arundo donax TaxID=35708 RepID=A0A0A8Z5K8_ARUDO
MHSSSSSLMLCVVLPFELHMDFYSINLRICRFYNGIMVWSYFGPFLLVTIF